MYCINTSVVQDIQHLQTTISDLTGFQYCHGRAMRPTSLLVALFVILFGVTRPTGLGCLRFRATKRAFFLRYGDDLVPLGKSLNEIQLLMGQFIELGIFLHAMFDYWRVTDWTSVYINRRRIGAKVGASKWDCFTRKKY